ncbi:SMI1/KNR4 family protein [Amycolatopsis sp. NPDC006125]|uniref:SMI1/KNR4 family protein n=1 Tax=Amycolatopsis sp. NPDC006125 TaxID=3156730 RepID=UPI0033B997CB
MRTDPAFAGLLRAGRHPLGAPVRADLGAAHGPVGELADLLSQVNGCTLANAGVQVFRVGPEGLGPELLRWNAPGTWKDTYAGLADGLLCFGQDLFGVQFAIEDNTRVVTFDPETGQREFVSDTLLGWTEWLAADADAHAARAFATRWQRVHGPLGYDERLIPLRFFVLGGGYDDDNLVVKDAVTCMRIRGPIARRLHDVPDGTPVRLSFE